MRIPIDDALGNIKTTEPSKQQLKKPVKNKEECNIMTYLYPTVLKTIQEAMSDNSTVYAPLTNKGTYTPKFYFDEKKIELFHEFIRFKDKCSVVITGINKNQIIQLVKEKNPSLIYLLEKTDLGEELKFPEKWQMTELYSYIKNQYLIETLQDVLPYKDIVDFENASKSIVGVPDLDYLSLFIKEGEKLRKYSQHAKNTIKLEKPLIIIHGNRLMLNFDKKIFNSDNLKRFCEETGITEIKEMINEIYNLNTVLEHYRRLEDVESAKKALFERLQTNTPSLIYQGE